MQLDGETESAAFARADTHIGGNGCLRRILLVLFGHEIQCPAEARKLRALFVAHALISKSGLSLCSGIIFSVYLFSYG